ncbi:MAG: DUF6429 family protein [Zoogloeaceae bacterium]|nr:DUF6429 family protein [Zoogloeaceae bacterium]
MDNAALIKDLTLVLLYLTSWEEKIEGDMRLVRSWKNYDWDAIDTLREANLLNGTNKAKSIYLTPAGVEEAKQVLEKLQRA